jgi:hypothetical protein
VRCVGKPYTYNPIVRVRIVLANDQFVAGGPDSIELGVQRFKCRQKPPDREHHCVAVFTNASLDVTDRGQLPCNPGSCHLNMVVEAHNKKKKKGKKGRRNKLLIGEDEPDGTVGLDKGRLNAIRRSPADQPGIPPQVTNTPLTTSIPIRKGEPVVVFSQELNGLQKDDQLAAQGSMNTSIDHLTYNVLVRSRVILAPDPISTRPGGDVKDITEPQGEIAEANGFNCTQRNPLCVTNKVGVLTMTKDAEDEAGDPIPLYANFAVATARPGTTAPAADTVQILPGGGLGVVTYPASLKG